MCNDILEFISTFPIISYNTIHTTLISIRKERVMSYSPLCCSHFLFFTQILFSFTNYFQLHLISSLVKYQLWSSQLKHMQCSTLHLSVRVSMQKNKLLKCLLTCPGWWLWGRPLSRYPPWCRGSSHSWRSAWCSWVYTLWGSRVLGSQSLVGGCRWWGPWHKDRTHERLWREEDVMNRLANNVQAYSMQAME